MDQILSCTSYVSEKLVPALKILKPIVLSPPGGRKQDPSQSLRDVIGAMKTKRQHRCDRIL